MILRKEFEIDGHIISFLEIENKFASNTFIILHGWGLSAFVYTELAKIIAKNNFRVIIIDLPGFGNSTSPRQLWGYEEFAKYISKLIATEVGDKVTLMGHSFGGGIAINIASSYPSQIERLLLVDSSGIPINLPLIRLGINKLFEMIIQSILKGGFFPSVKMCFSYLLNLINNPIGLYRSLELPIRHDLTNMLIKLKSPTKIYWAKKDLTIDIKIGEKMAGIINSPINHAPDFLYHDWCITHPKIFVNSLNL